MKKFFIFLAAVVLSCGLLSCSSDDDDPDTVKKVVDMLADPEPIQLTDAQKQFANDNNTFTLNFLKTVNETDRSGKSFIYSPLSITYVLGMVNAASTGETEKELEQTLGFHEGGIQAVNDYCKKLIEGLPKVDRKVKLSIANALFVNKNKATLKSEYQKDMQTYYNAEVKNLDFNSSSTLKTINGWAQEKTNNMIPTILDRIDPDVVTYLLNAIYFKANWNKKFNPNNTKTETFTTPNGTKQLPLMHQNVLINYMKNETYSSVLIPYDNSYWSIMVYLPEKGKTADDIINTFNPSNDIKAMSPCQVDLKLPRFETNSDTQNMKDGLIGLLEKMGIRRVFDSELAEIPNMCNTSVFISMMRQKAGIKVNEEGTETAVVTLGSGYASWAGPGGYEILKADFHANCPFVYVIRERSSNVILSVGKYTGM